MGGGVTILSSPRLKASQCFLLGVAYISTDRSKRRPQATHAPDACLPAIGDGGVKWRESFYLNLVLFCCFPPPPDKTQLNVLVLHLLLYTLVFSEVMALPKFDGDNGNVVGMIEG